MSTESSHPPLLFTIISPNICAPMSPSCCWFLVFVAVWWLPLMLVVAEDQQRRDCSAKKCGNVSISDPFWLATKELERPCGSLDFEVTCNGTISSLRSSIPFNNGFKILNISYEEHSLYAIDLGKLDVLHANNSCRPPFPFYNTSSKLNHLFRIDPVNLNLILYNCTEEAAAGALARQDRGLVHTRMRCENKWEVLVRVGVPHDPSGHYASYALEGCAAIVVPVPGSSAGANASDYEGLIRDGFLLTWERPRKFTRKSSCSQVRR
ncbi:unnamed protein product [Triticum turgidum subsp. durum]|uniref:Wall-associated receptor kinase galacturonan-binding domain-containing protein n=1 Tax=Triticum turgidum subsp. durum TaxID=4567 RepID=A0A9R1Q6A8_TRITD|nr:unnamed protein product [Triticum turgidum subsp. durum]